MKTSITYLLEASNLGSEEVIVYSSRTAKYQNKLQHQEEDRSQLTHSPNTIAMIP
jgi:hypothetical protein